MEKVIFKRAALSAAVVAALVAPGMAFAAQDMMSPEYGKSYSAFIDEGKLTGGLFYFQRERDRVQAGPGQDGKYHSNLSHATTQAALNFNSGYAWGVVGVDVGGFGAYDLAVDESNGVNEENEFSFWGDKWGSGGDGVPENGFSLSNAALKFKFGDAVTAKGGYTQLYVPGILGVNAGAAFAVVVAVGVLGIQSLFGYIWFAFAGALIASVVVYLVGRSSGGADPIRLVLTGVALTAVLEGVGQGLALVNPQAFDRLRTWNLGSLDIGSLELVLAVSGFVAAGLVLAALATRGLNAVALGEDTATSLGVSVKATRIMAIAAVTVLAGSAAATAGVIVFLGLMVPHLARRICGLVFFWVAGLSLLIAPTVLLLADVIGRLILPGELAAGIVVAFVGAPGLIALARGKRVIEL